MSAPASRRPLAAGPGAPIAAPARRWVRAVVGRTRVSLPALIGGALVLALGIVLNDYRHVVTPDLHIDEMIYTSVGQNLATGHGLSVQGQPFFWQPPLFFLLEWPFLWLAGLGGDGTLDAALQMRVLNGIIGAGTGVAIFAIGWRLRDAWTAWVMALLFMTDPFVVRVTRRLYLEPFAAVWLLAALWLVHASLGRWTWRRRLAVGVLFGLAVLSKELTAYGFAVPVLLWLRRDLGWREPVTFGAVAVATYLIYPLWAILDGVGAQLIDLKRFQYDRLVGVYHVNGFAKPGNSLTAALVANAGDYWTSYVCILLAVPATAWLWFRGDRTGRFLAAWSASSYVFIAAMGKFGSLEDQFFYFLMLPVLCILGYTYAFNLPVLVRGVVGAWRSHRPRPLLRAVNLSLAALVVGLAVLRPNVQVWVLRFGTETDNGYSQLLAAVAAHVPRGALLDEPGGGLEELHFAYPNGEYLLTRDKTPALLRSRDIHWFVLSTKDITFLNGIDQNYYTYITSHATRVWGVSEHTFHDFGLWYVADPASLPDVGFPIAADAPDPRPT